MESSVEVRWFFDFPPLDNSPQLHQGDEQPTRTDWYAGGVADGCGIKTREGNLETKLRVSDLGVRSIAQVRGRVEEWNKWSVSLPEHQSIPDSLLEINGWVPVTKCRRLRHLAVETTRVTEACDESVASGCQFECGEIFVRGAKFWTVGFEAFGERQQLWGNLQAAVEFVVREGLCPDPFEEACSFAYPPWLNQLGASTD